MRRARATVALTAVMGLVGVGVRRPEFHRRPALQEKSQYDVACHQLSH